MEINVEFSTHFRYNKGVKFVCGYTYGNWNLFNYESSQNGISFSSWTAAIKTSWSGFESFRVGWIDLLLNEVLWIRNGKFDVFEFVSPGDNSKLVGIEILENLSEEACAKLFSSFLEKTLRRRNFIDLKIY